MTNWPKEIPIPQEIGKGSYFRNGEPCCAVGHLHSLNLWSNNGYACSMPNKKIGAKFEVLYGKLCRILFPEIKYSFIVNINDNLSDENRRLLYLLTWAKLGYTEGMPQNVLKLLKNPKVAAIK